MVKSKKKKQVDNLVVNEEKKSLKTKTKIVAIISSILAVGSTAAVGVALSEGNTNSHRNTPTKPGTSYNTGYSDRTGSNNSNNSDNNNSYSSTTLNEEIGYVEIPTYQDINVSDSELGNLLQKKVSVDSGLVSSAISTIHGVQVQYDESDLFGIDEALSKYNSVPNSSQGSRFTVDENDLYNTVKANNAVFLTTGKGKQCWALSESDLRRAVRIVAQNANEKINAGYITDFNNLSKVLNELKIVAFSDFSTASTDDKSVVLAIDMSSVANKQSNNPDLDAFERTVKHEANHILQMQGGSSLDGMPYEIRYGISYKFPDLKMNSLYNRWFFETSAEYDASNGDRYLFYVNEIADFNSVLYSIILKNNVDSKSLSKLSFSGNLDSLFELFSADSKEDKTELLTMLYSFNMFHYTDEEFRALYEAKHGNRQALSEYEDYTLDLRRSCSLTLSKYFYTNLANYLSNNNVALGDVFTMVSLFENEVERLVWYASDYRNNANADFYEKYTTMQGEVFEAISKSNNIDIDTLYSSYVSFKASNPKYQPISCLNSDKNTFISNMSSSNVRKGYTSVYEAGKNSMGLKK